jgi:hypothetical protein
MSEHEARQALQQVLDRYQVRQETRHGLLGDGNGTVMVSGRPGWAFIRYREDLNRLSLVRYLLQEQMPDGTPVVVGRKYPGDPFEQVLGEDWTLYAWSPSQNTTDTHSTQVITLNDMAPGKVVPTNPVSLSVDTRGFLYVNGSRAVEHSGDTIDLTANVPGAAGHSSVLVYMDLGTDTLGSVAGDLTAVGVNAPAPDVPENGLPLAVVDLANGDTEIVGGAITQYKAPYLHVGGQVENVLGAALVYDGDVVTHDGSIVWVI